MRWFNFRKVGLTAGVVAAVSSGFVFSERSKRHLYEVCPPLIQVAECAIKRTTVDFMIIDGLRTAEEHAENLRKGVSWAKRSLHQDGLAIDFAVWKNGHISWDVEDFKTVYETGFKPCSDELSIPIIWGGHWRVGDFGHIELKNRVCYPEKEVGDA